MKTTFTLTIGIVCLLTATSSKAQSWGPGHPQGWGPNHCSWDGNGMRGLPGWFWNTEKHQCEEHDKHQYQESRKWCDRYPYKCW